MVQILIVIGEIIGVKVERIIILVQIHIVGLELFQRSKSKEFLTFYQKLMILSVILISTVIVSCGCLHTVRILSYLSFNTKRTNNFILKAIQQQNQPIILYKLEYFQSIYKIFHNSIIFRTTVQLKQFQHSIHSIRHNMSMGILLKQFVNKTK